MTQRHPLSGPADFDGFRAAARKLLARGVAPDHVVWAVDGEAALFDADSDDDDDTAAAPPSAVHVPPAFLTLCRAAALHRDEQRFHLLYRLLWRLQHEPTLRHDALDAEMTRARLLAQAVRRDMHKMKAFVRFRETPAGHVAWFEPEHHIVEATAPFFANRFTAMRWAILTPERCVRWDGERLNFGPGASRADAPRADAGEALWLTYYQSIFNPARLKLDAMRKEMPRRYWRNLPEAALITSLSDQAAERSGGMVAREPEPVARRVPLLAAVRTVAAASPPPADRVGTWQALRDGANRCRDCPIGAAATQAVWGEGPLGGASLMLVGEQPGDEEDLRGHPFVGPAGRLLDRALAQLGWDRGALYITNAVKHYKYELRAKRRIHKTPAQREADACLHWMESEIELVQPQAIVALGATAARQLLGRPVAVLRERGQWFTRHDDGIPVLVTLHPSALLRAEPGEREAGYDAWLADLRRADGVVRAAAGAADGA